MKRLLLLFLLAFPLLAISGEDWMWWNIKHGWQIGMPGWRMMIHITPGYLGPNALPVPEIKKGIVVPGNNLEFGMDMHFRTGDPTQNISGKYYRSFADNKIAIEVWGVMLEHYAMSDTVRDERIARDKDGKGIAVGDLYFATMIQLVKDRKFPDMMLRMAGRTASGGHLDAARYSDSPGYFFDLSLSKSYPAAGGRMTFRPYATLGFYSWQTNDELNLQNDALLYGAGAECKWANWTLSNTLGGYSGYKHERDRPMVYTLDLVHKLKRNAVRFQYLCGIRDWTYQTFKFSYIINLGR
jgi:hypothetical protein